MKCRIWSGILDRRAAVLGRRAHRGHVRVLRSRVADGNQGGELYPSDGRMLQAIWGEGFLSPAARKSGPG